MSNETIEVTLTIPTKMIDKVKIIRQLTRANSGSIEPMLVEFLDQAINQKILQELGIPMPSGVLVMPAPQVVAAQPVPRRAAAPAPLDEQRDVTEIAEGLGDTIQADEEAGASYAQTYEATPGAAQPKPQPKNVQASLKDEELERDLSVKDPNVEAAADATKVDPQIATVQAPEETFNDMLQGADVNARVAGSKRVNNPRARRAKVSNVESYPTDTT